MNCLIAAVSLCFGIAVGACGETHSEVEGVEDAGALPEVCAGYVSAYRACLTGLDRGATESIERRVSLTQAALVSAAKNDAGIPGLVETCATGLERLKTSCR